MKKIAVLLLLVLTIAGCGKRESGTITIQNNSSYKVTCGVGDNWTVSSHEILSGHTKQVNWKNYVLVWNHTPENIVTCERTGDTVVLKNNTPSYIVYIENKTNQAITIIDKIKIKTNLKDKHGNPIYIDKVCYALADNNDNNKYVDILNIANTPAQKEYAFYFSLRAENFQHASMAGCAVSFKTESIVRNGEPITRQVITLTK